MDAFVINTKSARDNFNNELGQQSHVFLSTYAHTHTHIAFYTLLQICEMGTFNTQVFSCNKNNYRNRILT